jgi:hypothetical protein
MGLWPTGKMQWMFFYNPMIARVQKTRLQCFREIADFCHESDYRRGGV